MQAIEVKFISCTNTKPDRYKASCSAGNKTYSMEALDNWLRLNNLPLSMEDRALAAAWCLTEILGWQDRKYYGDMVRGQLANGNYVFTFTCRDDRERIKMSDFIG